MLTGPTVVQTRGQSYLMIANPAASSERRRDATAKHAPANNLSDNLTLWLYEELYDATISCRSEEVIATGQKMCQLSVQTACIS